MIKFECVCLSIYFQNLGFFLDQGLQPEIELPIEPIGRVGSVGGSGSECKVEGAFCNEDSDCCDKNCKPGNFQGVCRAR